MADRALVVGRFQPLHVGHLSTLRRAAEVADRFVVAIGSAQRSHTRSDPFTAGERLTLLAEALADEGITAEHIVPVPDLGQYHLWAEHVRGWTPAFDLVVTGSPMTAHLFAQAGIEVDLVAPTRRAELSGTRIRARLLAGEDVSPDVPSNVARFLATDEVQARLRAIGRHEEGHG